jgi:uncharacterized protein YcbK (DUF882 family)
MKYFKHSEFDSPDDPGSGLKMDEKLLRMLDEARDIAKIPFKINSGYRTYQHNKKVRGKITSSHLKGLAVDISCTEPRQRSIILNSLIEVGFNRIGIGKSFIHVDIDKDKSPNVIWMY